MADLASTGQFFVNVAGGAAPALKVLTRVKDGSIDDERTTDTPLAVGVPRAAGFRRKQGGLKITLNVYEEVGKQPEVDWYLVNESRATFTLIFQGEGGGFRYAWTCQVSNVNRKVDAEGNVMQEVHLAAVAENRT